VGQKSKKSRPSAKSRTKKRILPRNTLPPVREYSAQIKVRHGPSKSLLTRSGNKRGRKSQVIVSEICNRAYDFKLILEGNRKRIDWKRLSAAASEQDIHDALKDASIRAREKFLYKPQLLLSTLKDKKFPKRDTEAQEQFVADSLAAEGRISIRRSRDIVQRDRSARKKRGKILRREFYIVCSCAYAGPALNDACPECGAEVSYMDFFSLFAIQG
jgi:hypothetical protein